MFISPSGNNCIMKIQSISVYTVDTLYIVPCWLDLYEGLKISPGKRVQFS